MPSVCDYEKLEFASYVEETTFYSYRQRLDEVIEKLEIEVSKFFEWFYDNSFKANPGKFQSLLSPFVADQ